MQFAAPPPKCMIENRNTLVIIAASMTSASLPGAPLADLNGQPVIVHVWRRAREARVGHVLVAAAEASVADVIWKAGGDALVTGGTSLTGAGHAAVALSLRDPQGAYRHIVTLRGDLPALPVLAIQRCLAGLTNGMVDVAVAVADPSGEADLGNRVLLKGAARLDGGRDIAFLHGLAREIPAGSPLPWHRLVGVASWRRAALDLVSAAQALAGRWPDDDLAAALEAGLRLAAVRVDTVARPVDTPAELEAVRRTLRSAS